MNTWDPFQTCWVRTWGGRLLKGSWLFSKGQVPVAKCPDPQQDSHSLTHLWLPTSPLFGYYSQDIKEKKKKNRCMLISVLYSSTKSLSNIFLQMHCPYLYFSTSHNAFKVPPEPKWCLVRKRPHFIKIYMPNNDLSSCHKIDVQ